ncbi:MAG: metallophosphoesterase [Dehalococcoidales bacterium]|nr:metallophosphoesterase [Dehalococcoidales bacterium]
MPSDKMKRILLDPDRVSELTPQETRQLLERARVLFDGEPNLLELTAEGRVVFIGDTHGDFEATRIVVARYLGDDRKLVFLGDYVDRGPDSKANLDYLLCLKLAYPDSLFLLQGNHEGYGVMRFCPADFWEGLDAELAGLYEQTLLRLPLAVSVGSALALHGALPDVITLSDVNRIQPGDEHWRQVVWGDWQEIDGGYLGLDAFTGRPQFGRGYFSGVMERLGKQVLVRSHQPSAPRVMYDRRCLTIFTSRAYMPLRAVAVADLGREIADTSGLLLETV